MSISVRNARRSCKTGVISRNCTPGCGQSGTVRIRSRMKPAELDKLGTEGTANSDMNDVSWKTSGYRARTAIARQPFFRLLQRFGQTAQHHDVARTQLGVGTGLHAANPVPADSRYFHPVAHQPKLVERTADRVGVFIDGNRL